MPEITNALSVPGGLSHRLLRLETTEAPFALKILSPRSVKYEASRQRLERAEAVAEIAFENEIPAVVAHRGHDRHFLQNVGSHWVLLFDWKEGCTLPPVAASEAMAALMGGLLGKLHALNIRFDEQSAPEPEAFANGHWEELASLGHAQGSSWASAIREALPELNDANQRAMTSQRALRDGWVTGHLDLDQKNVLWQYGQPTILDFESAKPIHPALEAVGAALNWAGQSAGDTSEPVFKTFLESYLAVNKISEPDLNTACDAVLGKWLIWLEFNLRRSLEIDIKGTPEEQICQDALWHALSVTLKLRDDIPMYQEWCKGASLPISRSSNAS